MAIGEIKLRNAPSTYSTARPVNLAQGVVDSISQLASTVGQAGQDQAAIEQALRNREQQREEMYANVRYQQFVTERALAQQELLREAPVDGTGLTELTMEQQRTAWEEFQSTLPEQLREKFSARHEQWLRGVFTSASATQFQLENDADRKVLTSTVQQYGAEVYSGVMSYDEALAGMQDLIGSSGLAPSDKDNFLEEADVFLRTRQYQAEVKQELARNNVESALPPVQEALLSALGRPGGDAGGVTPGFSSAFEQLLSAAPPEIRAAISVNNDYRSPDQQAQIIANEMTRPKFGFTAEERKRWLSDVQQYGPAEAGKLWADRFSQPRDGAERLRNWIALPGSSQHQRGNAADLTFGSKEAEAWVHQNAEKFGMKFPLGHEPWHIEVAGARDEAGWNKLADGSVFSDYSRHPNKPVTGPGGQITTAAGAFGLEYSVWERAKTALGLKDFSSGSQMLAALWYAETLYNEKRPLGMTFEEVLASGDPEKLASIQPALAEKWPAAARMTGDQWVRLLTRKDQAGLPSSRPNIWTDPRFENIPFDQRLSLFNGTLREFSQQASEQARVERAQREEAWQQVLVGAADGTITRNDVTDLRAQGLLTTVEQRNQLEKQFEYYQEVTRTTAEVNSILAGGPGTIVKARHEDALNKILAPAIADLQSGNQAAMADAILPTIQRAGFVPGTVAQTLVGMARGNDPSQRAFAMETLATLYTMNQYLLEDSTSLRPLADDAAFVAAGHTLYSSTAETMQQLEWRNNPENKPFIEARREAAMEELTTTYDAGEIKQQVFNSWFKINEPELPMNPQQLDVMQADFRRAYIHGYETFGSDEGALAFAKEQMLKTWGVSEASGTARVMKFPPELFYGPDADRMIREQVRQELVRQGKPADTPYVLVPTPDTERAGAAWRQDPAAAGHNAPYNIILYDKNGRALTWLGDNGQPWVFNGPVEQGPDGTTLEVNPFPGDQMELENARAQVINANSQLAQARQRYREAANEYETAAADPARAETLRREMEGARAEMERLQETIDGYETFIAQKSEGQMVSAVLSSAGVSSEEEIKNLTLEEIRTIISRIQDAVGPSNTIYDLPEYKQLVARYEELRKQ